MSIRNNIQHMIKCSLSKLELNNEIEELNIMVERPAKKENGDYSSNIALTLTKILKKSPMLIAEEIKNNIDTCDIVEEIKIAAPGFINFYLKKEFLLNQINKIIDENKNYGRSTIGNNKKININKNLTYLLFLILILTYQLL